MSGRQIPNSVWRAASGFDTDAMEAFMEEAGLLPDTEQRTLCAFCAAEGETSAPESIIFIKGTSLCINHSKNMLD